MPRARSPKIVFRKPLERSNPHQCPETPRKSEGDRDTRITVLLYPRKYLNPKPFKTHFTSPALQTDVSSEFQPISNTLSQGAVSLQPQDAQCSSPPLPPSHTPSLIPYQIWAACIKQAHGRTGTLQQRGWQVSRLFKSGRKPATARPPQVLLTPTNCLLHSRRKTLPLSPQPSLAMCAARAGSLRSPLLPPPGSQLYTQGKVTAAIITHTIPQLLAC